MNSYKKRAKNGWRSGKSYKSESNRTERKFALKEIDEQLGRTRTFSSRRKLDESPFLKKVKSLARFLRFYESLCKRGVVNSSFGLSWFSRYKETKKELVVLMGDPSFFKIKLKIRKEIERLIETEVQL